MIDTNIINKANQLFNLNEKDRRKKWEILEQYSVVELENLAAYIYDNHIYFARGQLMEILTCILALRSGKLMKDFKWTKETHDAFMQVNDKLLSIFTAAYKEAELTASQLEARIENNDKFLQDYEIEIQIEPHLKDCDNENNHFGFVLSEPINDFYPISEHISHSGYGNKDISVYLDTSYNWNIEYVGSEFKNDYISYCIHNLLDNNWSIQDILNIDQIWANVRVDHQYNEKVKII
jgi:hypothetical protein